jgi:hypothetical protein
MTGAQLRDLIRSSLRKQGFRIRNGRVELPAAPDKDLLRRLHATAVAHRVERSEDGLRRHEPELLAKIANGADIHPERIAPKLVRVRSESFEELLFRYACLHWSVPVSSGYGRRLRYLVVDDSNGKLMGILGLGDPVINLRARDEYIGWTPDVRRLRLGHVMDVFALGAVPPYSHLLCGKLVALLATSNEVRRAFRRKYAGRKSRIRRHQHDGRLALLTTTSALGRSSLYNRLNHDGDKVYCSVGFTEGFGEFHFSNGLYSTISDYAKRWCEPSERKSRWGDGYRNRREVLAKCLRKIGLSKNWLVHGVQREVFVVPLASNALPFLRGEQARLLSFDRPASTLIEAFRNRWLLPRAERDDRYQQWTSHEWRLWSERRVNRG